MEKIGKKTGIILKTQDYKENASLLTILTSTGLVTLILRGAKKTSSKNHLLNNIFNEISFNQTMDKSLNTLTEAVVINSHYNIYQDIIKLNYVYIIIEKILVLNSSITDFNTLYSFLSKILYLMDETKYPNVLTSLFELKLCYLLGIGPSINRCVVCNNKTELNYFSISLGGILCNECKNSHSLHYNNEISTIIKYLYLINIDLVNDDFLEKCVPFYGEIDLIINQYYENYLDFKSKSKLIISKLR